MSDYRTASVEILDDNPEPGYARWCSICRSRFDTHIDAAYNVFDGYMPLYSCRRHLAQTVCFVATRKG